MTHVVNLSGGITSWMAGRLVVDRIAGPADRVVLLFADTLIESPDVYRFLEAGTADLGEPVTRIADGRTPWQLFRDERMLGNNRVAMCSRILKRELIETWRTEHCDSADSEHHVGLDWQEINRFETHRSHLGAAGWVARAPLIEFRVTKADALVEARRRGLPVPDAYRDGFSHANCGGTCVRAGIGHWAKLWAVHPDRFSVAMGEEDAIRASLGKDVSILRDRSGGESRPMPLRVLHERLKADKCDGLDLFDIGGCGCAVDDDSAP